MKIDYLDKIFNFVGIVSGKELDVRSAKVVAGMEPQCTCMFFKRVRRWAADA